MNSPSKKPKSWRWQHLNRFVDVTLRDVTPSEVRVWLILYRDTKQDGTVCAGQTNIAMRAGLSVRMVKKAVQKLIERGIVKVLVRGRLNAGPSLYKVRGVNPS